MILACQGYRWRGRRSTLLGFQSSSGKDPGQIPGDICVGKNPSHVIKFPIFEAVVSSALDRVWGKLGAGRCYLNGHQPHWVVEMNVPSRNDTASEALGLCVEFGSEHHFNLSLGLEKLSHAF